MLNVSLYNVTDMAAEVADKILNDQAIPVLYGVPRGGVPAVLAVALATSRRYRNVAITDDLKYATAIIDDIYDSGATAERHKKLAPNVPFFALFDKRTPRWAGQWLVMPWERNDGLRDESATDIVTRLLQFIGEDPQREGLKDTPARVIKAWTEWTRGYGKDPEAVLKTFDQDLVTYGKESVVVHNIPIISKCEHHLSDIVGTCHVSYTPRERVVGLSKIPRVVDIFARRLQVQERLTQEIANALFESASLRPLNVAVLMRCAHHCMSTRGVNVHGAVTTTSTWRGHWHADERHDFLIKCQMAENAHA